jgi:hypothetical protein
MVGGFNTNVRYRGRIFHVQTEDSGAENPHIITLLYEGGAILDSRKQSYADEVDAADLDTIVREMMEEQHRSAVQSLKSGALDRLIGVDMAATAPPRGRPTAPEPIEFGRGIISTEPLDAVILAHLASS